MPSKILTFGISVWSRHNMLLHVCIGFDLIFEAHILTAITVTYLWWFCMGPLQYNLDNLDICSCWLACVPGLRLCFLSIYRYFPLCTGKLLTWSKHAPERCNNWLPQYDWRIVERGITPKQIIFYHINLDHPIPSTPHSCFGMMVMSFGQNCLPWCV